MRLLFLLLLSLSFKAMALEEATYNIVYLAINVAINIANDFKI